MANHEICSVCKKPFDGIIVHSCIPPDPTISMTLKHREAFCLAKFIDRVYYNDITSKARDNEEHHKIATALQKLRAALKLAGYDPR